MAVRRRRLFRWSSLALVALSLGLAACTENYPRSSLAPASDFARIIDDLFETITWWGVAVFVLVEGLLVYVILRFRRRPGAPEERPEQVHGHTRLEIAWTVAPALILAFIAVPTIRVIFVTQDDAPIPGALEVRVVGHQWWWEFEYPELGIVTANELHVPVDRTVSFDLLSADVIHSFWVPRLGGKRDLIPPHTNHLWFTPDSTGTYLGQCAEYCGHSHALMGFRVVVDSPQEFAAWVANEQLPAVGSSGAAAPPPANGRPAAGDTSAQARAANASRGAVGGEPQAGEPQGADTGSAAAVDERVAAAQEPPGEPDAVAAPVVGPDDASVGAPGGDGAREPASTPEDSLARTFAAVGDPARGAQLAQGVCAACHAIEGTSARGRVGPNLTHVASRDRIAAELLPNDPDAMARWLRDPPAVKPGAKMPNLNLKEDQIADLVAYLSTLE